MVKRAAALGVASVVLGLGCYGAAAATTATTPGNAAPLTAARALCGAGYVDALIGGAHKCLRAGEFCSPSHEPDYERYGFACLGGHLQARTPGTTAPSTTRQTTILVGQTVKLAPRTQARSCTPGPRPDRQCSPGAYYSGLTRTVLCSSTFRTGSIRNVPESEKHQVEVEYGMVPRSYGRTIEIDHIVSLELGGSNDIANLYPEPGSGPASYHVKDRLENRLHDLVCAGSMTLHASQSGIASNWEALYRRVFGIAP
jgi:hypothetical protein